MTSERINETMSAIESFSAEEMLELESALRDRLGYKASEGAKLKLFSTLSRREPSLYCDSCDVQTIWLENPGENRSAFIDVIMEFTEKNRLYAYKLYDKLHGTFETEAVRLDYERGNEFTKRLREAGAEYIYESEGAAEYRTTPVTSLPIGCEDKIYRALTRAQNPEPGREYTIYEYRVSPVDGAGDISDQSGSVELTDPVPGRNGLPERHAYTLLNERELRVLFRRELINFKYCYIREYSAKL